MSVKSIARISGAVVAIVAIMALYFSRSLTVSFLDQSLVGDRYCSRWRNYHVYYHSLYHSNALSLDA